MGTYGVHRKKSGVRLFKKINYIKYCKIVLMKQGMYSVLQFVT